MKKRIHLILAAAMLLSVLAGCGGKQNAAGSSQAQGNQPSSDGSTAADPAEFQRYDETQYLSVTANNPGGSFYSIAAAYQPLWDEKLNVSVTIMPGGSTENLKSVSRGDSDMGFTHHTVTYMANQGMAPFDQVYNGVLAMAPVTPAAVQFIVLANSPITDLSQIGDKKIGLGTVGATANAFVLPFLEHAYGITPDRVSANGGSISYLSDSEVTTALQDGQVDIALAFGIYPKPNIQELENTPGIKLVPLDEAKLDAFIAENPQWTKYFIPANSYVGQTDEICSVAAYALISCSASLDEELVYQMVKVMWECQEEAGLSSVEVAEWMHIEDVPKIMEAAPLHPGAERYYKEIGMI